MLKLQGQASYVSTPLHFGTIGGTPCYQDPSLSQSEQQRRFGEKLDVYSTGIVLLDLFPLASNPSVPPSCDNEAWVSRRVREIVDRCLCVWEKRLTSAQLLEALETLYRDLNAAFPTTSSNGSEGDSLKGKKLADLRLMLSTHSTSGNSLLALSTATTSHSNDGSDRALRERRQAVVLDK